MNPNMPMKELKEVSIKEELKNAKIILNNTKFQLQMQEAIIKQLEELNK